RMLSGLLATQDFLTVLTGDESLCSRPMQRIIKPLEAMGAHVSSDAGRPPLTLQGSRALRPITYKLPVASAQVKSCILFAAVGANGTTEIVEPLRTRDHTERLFGAFGVPVELSGEAQMLRLTGPAWFKPRHINIPGDISSAAYFVAATLLVPNSELIVEQVSLNPTRIEFISLFQKWGAEISLTDIIDDCNEPAGSIVVRNSRMQMSNRDQARVLGQPLIPALIDELPLIAVVGTQLPGGITIKDAGELRVKETDRLKATAEGLKAMGAEVEEHRDGLVIGGPVQLRGARVDSRRDHRIAMAFSVAALVAEGETEIAGADCVDVSFPEFFQFLERLTKD
ncbi:MAG: 3-phosphoshikimate 1-carboxyvinyltransferase, partial [Pyrinomonadaceae bacterium]